MPRALDRAQMAVERHRTGQASTLRVGFQASVAGALLTAIRAAFTLEYPGVTREQLRFDGGQEVAALRAGEIDIAVVWQPQHLSGLASAELSTEARYIGLPAAHLAWNPEEHNPTIGKFVEIARATRPEG